MSISEQITKQDIEHLWHPFTQMQLWPQEPPVVIARGEGNWLIDADGKRYFDGVSSLWVTVHGHNHPVINQAIRDQLEELDHSTLLGLTHPLAAELAAELAAITPGRLNRAFYSESGSTAVEIALKIAFQYWQQSGRPEKKGFVALGEAYHGDTIGAVSVGGIDLFHQVYGPLLFPVHRLPQPFCRQCPLGLSHPACGLACAQALEPMLAEHGESIAALIVEPRVQGAAGMIVQPEGYLRRLWEICQAHDVLFIADEVATGFGRTGKLFACELEGVAPDLMCLGKGITGGVLPLAATMATDRVYQAFLGEFSEFKTFFHGHTYTGNPLACAAALASLRLFQDNQVVANTAPLIARLQKGLAQIAQQKHVVEVRQQGMMCGIELAQDKATDTPLPARGAHGPPSHHGRPPARGDHPAPGRHGHSHASPVQQPGGDRPAAKGRGPGNRRGHRGRRMTRAPALAALADRARMLREQGLGRGLVSVGPSCGRWAEIKGQRCLLMASNDYLGLAGHPRLAQAAVQAAATRGTGSGASRLISGTLESHLELERSIAAFKHTEAALFFPTGYMTNLGVVTALAGEGDLIVSDQLNHASLIDACRLSHAQVKIYPHGDAAQAARLLAQGPEHGLKLLVSDGVFSMDGDLAPIPALLAAAREHGALLVIDDAHATGVYGPHGRGTLEHFGLEPCPELVMSGTFSKALGGLGGYAAGADEVIQALVDSCRPFIYSTAPPPTQVAVAQAGLELVDQEPWRRDRLRELGQALRSHLADAGLTALSQEGPIVPVLVGNAARTVALGQALIAKGVFAPAVRPPTVPAETSRIRLTVTAAHEMQDMEMAAHALAEAAQEVGL